MIPKIHKLLGLFHSPGIEYHINDVFENTGIVSLGSLKTTFYDLRKRGKADIRIKFNFVKRHA
jgi:hypothetical protein